MTDTRQEHIRLIKEVLVLLNLPVSADEKSHGWTVESKQAAAKYFTDVLERIAAGEPLPPLDIVRGLDHWGVTGGDLLEKIARAANVLRGAYSSA